MAGLSTCLVEAAASNWTALVTVYYRVNIVIVFGAYIYAKVVDLLQALLVARCKAEDLNPWESFVFEHSLDRGLYQYQLELKMLSSEDRE